MLNTVSSALKTQLVNCYYARVLGDFFWAQLSPVELVGGLSRGLLLKNDLMSL